MCKCIYLKPNKAYRCEQLKNEGRVNLVFALDASTSVDDAEFVVLKNFIKLVVDGIDDIDRFAVGLLQYATS